MNIENLKKEDLIEYYKSGKTMKEVAFMYGVSDEKISRINKEKGVDINDYKKNKIFRKLSKEDLINYFKSGLTQKDVAKMYGVDVSLVRTVNKEYGIIIKDYKEYQLNYSVHMFDNIDTEEKAYWLGFLCADGNVRKLSNEVSIQLSYVDIDPLRKFKDFMQDTRNDSVLRVQNRLTPCGNPQKMVTYQVCSPVIKNSLMRLGCIPKKSLVLVFPDLEIFENKDLVYDFIRGYIDGDGCLSKGSGGRLCVSVRGTKNFLEGIRSIFPNDFKKVYSEIDKRNHIQYRLCCCSDKADLVAKKLYKNSTVYLDRKYKKFTELCRNI